MRIFKGYLRAFVQFVLNLRYEIGKLPPGFTTVDSLQSLF